VANIDSAVATQFDLDHDGMADLRSYPSPLKAGSAVVQSVSYFLDRQISESAVSLQASRDGQNWTTLTPILDYTSVRTPAASTDGLRDSIQLTIPSSSDVLWQFRLIGIPEER